MPNAWQWNLSVQREVFKDAKLEVAYVANKNNHWEQRADLNVVPPADRLTLRPARNSGPGCMCFLSSQTIRSACRQQLHHLLLAWQQLELPVAAGVTSTCESMTTSTSRLLTPGPSCWPIHSASILLHPNVDGADRHASYGPDLLNHPHIFSASLVYGLPMLSSANPLVRGALGGWEASTIVSLSSGPSITPLVSVQGLGDPSGVGNGATTGRERPDRVAGQPCRASGADSKTWLNPNMFTVNGFQLGQIGNSGIGICSGPPTRNVDFGVDKNFKVTERIKMQFRMEFFNLFNHPQYTAGNVIDNSTINFNAPVFGDANGNGGARSPAPRRSCRPPRSPSTRLAGDLAAQNVRENGFRQIQYALKIIF